MSAHDEPSDVDLGTVIIYTARMDDLAEFYRQVLGLGAFRRMPSHVGQRIGSVYFGFDQIDEASVADEGSVAASPRITLWFTVDDLELVYNRAKLLGADIRYPPTEKPWGARLAAVYDPDGNVLGLAQREDTIDED
jgi:predicted enzyme related to lactoylglutathione lyase